MNLIFAISPHGWLHLEDPAEAATPSTPSTPSPGELRVREAFSQSVASGLEQLAVLGPRNELSASAAFANDFARLYFTRISRIPDLDGLRDLPPLPSDTDELATLLRGAPPLRGLEYLNISALRDWWDELDAHVRQAVHGADGGAGEYLRRNNPALRQLGRVTFHLAENKRDADRPFAFMATWANKVSATGNVQHQPLSRALQQYAGPDDRATLVSLLAPIDRAGNRLPWVKQMVEDGAVFRASAWTPQQAHQFLTDVPTLEASGLMVRVPDWWSSKRPARPVVSVRVGEATSNTLGVDSLLDFSVGVTLEGQDVTPTELTQLLSASEGLVRLRGKWVELDRDKLKTALDHWKEIESDALSGGGGISFAEGMRLLAGADINEKSADAAKAETRAWTGITAGSWLTRTLDELRDPAATGAPPAELNATLRPYQLAGVHWLRFMTRLGLGACLADDMGLGKTIQVIALLLHMKAGGACSASLLVVPTSLISNWKAELRRFAPSLTFAVSHPSEPPERRGFDSARTGPAGVDLVITTYGMITRDDLLREREWNLVILDEAQAIKNSGTRQTKSVKQLHACGRVALTGTPVENRLSDLWSLFDFLNPGLLGTAPDFTKYVRDIERAEEHSYAPIRDLISPYILRRLKTDRRIIADLPDKTEVSAYCGLSKEQAVLYETAVRELASKLKNVDEPAIQRRGMVLAFLMRFKQICNHPSQWTGDGGYEPSQSGKFQRLAELCEELAERQEKVLVFTQFREMTEPLSAFLHTQFGRPGLVLHGGTSVPHRRQMVDAFQRDDGPPFFVLSLKAGGTGLNLTQASQVIHFDRWWNPAVESQATDRAFRIGQKRNVMVHKFVCRGTVEEKIDQLIADKRGLSSEVLGSGKGAEQALTEMNDQDLLKLVSLDLSAAVRE